MTKLIPFNLERALAGDPVVTRNGRKVLEIHLFKNEGLEQPLVCIVDEDFGDCEHSLDQYFTDGVWIRDTESTYDLFMTPKTKTYWANVYISDGNIKIGHAFGSEKEVFWERSQMDIKLIKTISFDVEC